MSARERDGPPLAMTANNEDNTQPPAPAAPSEPKPLSTDIPPLNSSSDFASSSPPSTPDRSELLIRARHFLSSPQVIDQDHESKRRFLVEKGLTDGEIQLLLREMVRLLHTCHPTSRLNVYAFTVPRSSTSDVPYTSPITSSRTSRRYFQGAFMASGRLHGSALYLLRAHAPASHLPLTAQTRSTWPASDSYFPALHNLRSPVARSRHTKATFSQS